MRKETKKKGKKTDALMFECPYCGRTTFQGRWGKNGIVIVKEVLGCQHWTGTGDEEYFSSDGPVIGN